MSQQPVHPSLVVPAKSVGVAVILSVFFGPIGMLYSTIAGAAVIFVANLLAIFLTAGIGLIVTWPAGVVWAAMAASGHNQKLLAGSTRP